MPADANIFQQYMQAPRSVLDYQAAYDQADARKNALQQSVLALQKGQMDMANAADVMRQRNALRNAVSSGQLDLSNPDHVSRALSLAPDVAPAMLETIQKGATSRAQAAKDTAQAGQISTETQAKAVAHMSETIAALQQQPGVTPGHVVAAIQNAGKLFGIPDALVQQAVSQVPTDPAQLPAFLQTKNAQLMSAKERQSFISPDANTVATNATSRANNAATNATSRANNQATINKDLTIAGVSQDGTPNANIERMAQAIAEGKAAPITGFALARPQGQTVMRRVFEINPNYDETTYSAKNAAAKAFTSGQQGNALRSVATANAHLDQMNELVDALNNGNVQIVNRIANAYATQTGNPAPTNFDAVKNIIGQEVVKAIVANGGSAGERDEAAAAFLKANSPAQLKGAIQHYRMIMGAQQQNLLEQRRAAGLPDSTLPDYTGKGAAPAGGIDTNAIAAELKRRGVK